MNLTVELTTDQIVSFVQQMPPEERQALLTIAEEAAANRASRMARPEDKLRQLCAARGLNWDTMTEDEREELVDSLIHEDRECSP